MGVGILFSLIPIGLGFYLLYWIIRYAVRRGTLDAYYFIQAEEKAKEKNS